MKRSEIFKEINTMGLSDLQDFTRQASYRIRQLRNQLRNEPRSNFERNSLVEFESEGRSVRARVSFVGIRKLHCTEIPLDQASEPGRTWDVLPSACRLIEA